MIVDAGGGTIDISSYSETEDGTYEEIAVPQCSFFSLFPFPFLFLFFLTVKYLYDTALSFGSVLVNFLAMSFLEGDAKYSDP